MNVKAKEAQPILKRNQYYFKIVTLYVMDKLNYNLERKHKDMKKQDTLSYSNANTLTQTAVSINQSAPSKGTLQPFMSGSQVDADDHSQHSLAGV